MFPFRSFFALSAVLTSAMIVVACGGDSSPDDPTPAGLTLAKIGGFEGGALGASEITAYDAASKRLFVVNGANGTVDVLDLSDPANPRRVTTLNTTDLGPSVNSVDVSNGIVALAVEASPKTSPGSVVFYRASDLARLSTVQVGALPDMLVFTPDGRYVLVANEGEPNSYGRSDSVDPEGSVSVIEVNRMLTTITSTNVRTARFTAFDSQAASLRAQGVRIYGPGATVSQDLEPEYISVAPDGRTAYVALQENNAIANLDIATATITAIRPLGLKDHRVAGQGLDPSDEDGGTDTNSGTAAFKVGNWPVFGMYLPDGIASYSAGGQTYIVTANEGDARADWPGFNEEERIRSYCSAGLDPAVFGSDAARLLFDSNLGRLRITNQPNGGDNGKNSAGQCNKLWAYGARSFSIWRAADMTRVFDSGEEMERRTSSLPMALFNASNDNNTLDSRSASKGPEPESVTLATFGTKVFAFVGLERVGGVMVFDVTNPSSSTFVTYLNTRTAATGDRGPEGLAFIPASRSPNGKPLLIVANEISGSTAVFQINLSF
jgi:DNA-binding beta-propeller fold protein YncE